MKKLLVLLFPMLLSLSGHAQNPALAKKVLEKTGQVIGRTGGVSANFTISSSKYGSTSGTLAIKGTKFNARTDKALVWYNGKTQWSYLKSTNEVNVSTPTQAQRMSMNPYSFISIWKTGYSLGITSKGANYIVHLSGGKQKRTINEMYITVNKNNYIPSLVKMRQGQTWSTISIRNFHAKNQPNSIFTFNSKEYPSAEIIDLR